MTSNAEHASAAWWRRITVRAAWRYLRALRHPVTGRHTAAAIMAALDDQWTGTLRKIRDSINWDEPSPRLFAGPGIAIELPYRAAGSYSRAPVEVHHDLPGRGARATGGDHPAGEPPSRPLAAIRPGLEWMYRFLTCPPEFLDDAVKADKLSLAFARRSS